MTARARLFVLSGRDDPAWDLPRPQLEQLEAVWSRLPEASPGDRAEVRSRLGYRGAEAIDGDRRWVAVDGLVTFTSGQASETRRDPDRTLERQIATSAPPGTVPDGLVPAGW